MELVSPLDTTSVPVSPKSTGINAAPIYLLWFLHNANTVGTTSLVPLHLFFQTSLINWAVLTGNGNMENMRERPTKMTKVLSATVPGPYPSINTTFGSP
jgi:hypothetical protein